MPFSQREKDEMQKTVGQGNPNIKEETDALAALLQRKRADYGTKSLELRGTEGVLTRITDKLCRIENLTKSGATPNFESIEDTWRDIAGYGILGLLMHKGTLVADKDEAVKAKAEAEEPSKRHFDFESIPTPPLEPMFATAAWGGPPYFTEPSVQSRMIYLAGPVQKSSDFGHGWRNHLAEGLVQEGFVCFDPSSAFKRGDQVSDPQKASMDFINRFAIRSSVAVVAHLERSSWNVGTVREIEFARSLDLPVIVLTSDNSLQHRVAMHDLCIVYNVIEALAAVIRHAGNKLSR